MRGCTGGVANELAFFWGAILYPCWEHCIVGIILVNTGGAQDCWEHCVGVEEAEGRSERGVGTVPSICELSPGETEAGVGTGWPVER